MMYVHTYGKIGYLIEINSLAQLCILQYQSLASKMQASQAMNFLITKNIISLYAIKAAFRSVQIRGGQVVELSGITGIHT